MREGYTFVRMNLSSTLRKTAVDTCDFLKEQSTTKFTECPQKQSCVSKVSYLEEEIKMRNQ
jgi:hypothetical protein